MSVNPLKRVKVEHVPRVVINKWQPQKDKAYHLAQYPNSLVAQYFAQTSKVGDMDVLTNVLRTNAYRVEHDIKQNTIMIHLRLGDVMNWPYMRSTVQDYLDKAIPFDSYKGHAPILYIQPSSYFVTELAKIPCKKVEFVYGSHRPVNMTNSMLYLDKLTKILEKEGYECTRRDTNNPDMDFLYLCFAPYLIPSGGGFSQLAKTMNTMLKS